MQPTQQLPIIQRAMEHGQRTAIRSGRDVATYQELVAASGSLAGALLDEKRDLHEARIAFLVPPGPQYVHTQWGIWRAGGIAVPLSLSATERELAYTLTDSQVSAVVATSELLGNVESPCKQHQIALLRLGDLSSDVTGKLPVITTDRRAMMLYTSGTTSKPKGVVTTHDSIQAQIESLITAWHWQPEDRIPLFLPLHHIHGIINVMSCAMWSGAEVDAFPRFDARAILRRVADRAYTVFMAVPTVYVKLIETLGTMSAQDRLAAIQGFAEMRLMVSGSAALPASVHEEWTSLTGQKLLERYGMTEIGMALSNPYDGERRPGAVGQPLPQVEVRLQSESGDPVDDGGVSGEIQVRGPTVFCEYWNRAEETEASFVEGWFRTGDIAVIENGYYRILGRSSVDIIKSGGYKLSALEIEAALLDHPAIAQCAVVGLPDDTWGEIVAAAVVTKANEALDAEAVQSWCQDRMSPYKIPRKLLVVGELPRNAMGKVTKPAVTDLFAE